MSCIVELLLGTKLPNGRQIANGEGQNHFQSPEMVLRSKMANRARTAETLKPENFRPVVTEETRKVNRPSQKSKKRIRLCWYSVSWFDSWRFIISFLLSRDA